MVKSYWHNSFADLLSIAGVSALAIAHPLLAVLAQGDEYFAIRELTRLDLILALSLLLFGLPTLLYLPSLIAKPLSVRLSNLLFSLAIWPLFAAFFIPWFSHWGLDYRVSIALGLLVASIITILYHRTIALKQTLKVLSLSIIVVPAIFLSDAGVRSFLAPQKFELGRVSDSSRTPVAMLIFDEFSLNMLLDKDLQVDEKRFPNFAALARTSTWYRNATAVNQFTPFAVPPILSGKFPNAEAMLPTINNYPGSLFTLLRNSHQIQSQEPITGLCPKDLCGEDHIVQTFHQRLSGLYLDALAILANVLLPSGLDLGQPDITGQWGNFWNDSGEWSRDRLVRGRRVHEFLKYVNQMTSDTKPPLFFLHSILPHLPFQFLPSGKQYTTSERIRGYQDDRWQNDPHAIERAVQRYLMQIGAVDTLLGKFVAKLKELGIYDRTLLVVTADHGISFHPGTYRRGNAGHDRFYQDVMSVPLFIKRPGQTTREISDINMEAIDILPTIADILGLKPWWRVDGRSATDQNIPPRKEKRILVGATPKEAQKVERDQKKIVPGTVLTFPVLPSLPQETLNWKFSLPGVDSDNPAAKYFVGPHAELLGKELTAVKLGDPIRAQIKFDRNVKQSPAGFYIPLKKLSRHQIFPIALVGTIGVSISDTDEPVIAAVVNGKVRDITYPYIERKTKEKKVQLIIAEESLTPGRNKLELFRVTSEPSGKVIFQPLVTR